MSDVMADRRNSPRFALILLATIAEPGSEAKIAARTSDVSKTGCYVDTESSDQRNQGPDTTEAWGRNL